MELEEIITLAVPDTFADLKQKLSAVKPIRDTATFIKQYDPYQHDVMDILKRKNKPIETDEGKTFAEVTRLPIPLQKKIVKMSAAFLCANPIELLANPSDDAQSNMVALVKKTWLDNKLHYDSKTIATILMSQTEVAELWYFEDAAPEYWANTVNATANVKYRLRMKILAPSLGDELIPVFNKFGDMVAFARGYFVKEGDKRIEHFDVYTADKTYKGTNVGNGFFLEEEPNPAKKIPVIYYSQPAPEWHDVELLIKRLETLISNHGDSNDYFGSPVVFVNGEIEGFAKKGEQGKVLVGKKGAKAEYLTWDQAPESVKLELNNLRSLIFDMTDTPDLSLEQMKGIGTFSGIALKMVFLGAHLKAADKEENFGKAIQRRINFLISAMAVINVAMSKGTGVEITPKFTYFLPDNDKERMDLLSEGITAGILSKTTGVRMNPVVENPEEELKMIAAELTNPDQLGGAGI